MIGGCGHVRRGIGFSRKPQRFPHSGNRSSHDSVSSATFSRSGGAARRVIARRSSPGAAAG
jgi:hypothetical protein